MLTVETSTPSGLLTKIKTAIDEGHIRTWSYDSEGDFTHTAVQWNKKAWFRPSTVLGSLRFGLIGQNGVVMSKDVYGTYHGHFMDTLLRHFDNDLARVCASAHKIVGLDLY